MDFLDNSDKLSHSPPPQTNIEPQLDQDELSQTSTVKLCSEFSANMDSSFNFDVRPGSQRSTASEMIIDINDYIPVGSLRIHLRTIPCVDDETWDACSSWVAFNHPADAYDPSKSPFLPNILQQKLFDSNYLAGVQNLHNATWVRLEFRINDKYTGQVRVYVLPDDVGHKKVDRRRQAFGTFYRKSMQSLLARLDTSQSTWNGQWSEDTPIIHLDPLQDRSNQGDTLFHVFNHLPSPKPDTGLIINAYVRDSMERILDSDIQGLHTTMYMYQRRSAALMLQRETQPARSLDPRLAQMTDKRCSKWFCDIAGGFCYRSQRTYEAPRGGILAETMGLGKTLICLSLILATKGITSQVPPQYSLNLIPVRKTTGSLMSIAAATMGRHAIPWKNDFVHYKRGGLDFLRCREVLTEEAGHYYIPPPVARRASRCDLKQQARKIWLSGATIVMVPANLVQQWQAEIRKHCPRGLTVLLMDDNLRALPAAKELAQYDLILFSKARFEKEAKDKDEVGEHDGEGVDSLKFRPPFSPNLAAPQISSTRGLLVSTPRSNTVWNQAATDVPVRQVSRRATVHNTPKRVPYHSPLKDVHFKRLIVDEGHNFGNSSRSSRTEALTVVDFLLVTCKWIVSGTPTQGLYGAEIPIDMTDGLAATASDSGSFFSSSAAMSAMDTQALDLEANAKTRKLFYKQERKDLEKLGNIATSFLEARPWANSGSEKDHASWSQLMMQPHHGSNSKGNIFCLQATFDSIIIRHRPEDVAAEIILPPLHQKTVYLEGSAQNKIALSVFTLMIVTNAVTSERKDADYFFHLKQRKNLMQLVSNLRQASFFWSGFEIEHIHTTVEIAKTFLEKGEVPVTSEDVALLLQAIETGQMVLKDKAFKAIQKSHEMPLYIRHDWPEDISQAWSLFKEPENPMPIGATMLHAAQLHVGSHSSSNGNTTPEHSMFSKAKQVWSQVLGQETKKRETQIIGKEFRAAERAFKSMPVLAGGVAIGDVTRKLKRPYSAGGVKTDPNYDWELLEIESSEASGMEERLEEEGRNSSINTDSGGIGNTKLGRSPSWIINNSHFMGITDENKVLTKDQAKSSQMKSLAGTVNKIKVNEDKNKMEVPPPNHKLKPDSYLASTAIISTASAKLSYLMDQVVQYSKNEKILIFYEADNTAYYIAQALECLRIKHLIYAKSLSSARRSQYVVTFNQTSTFRVLLMDVSQAAFGLDMSSASRVYFVNPVFNPQVEAQAVKRAHRIGQTKPVYVETLVLRGSVEEVLMERRRDMSEAEAKSCKTILDDQKLYDWIRNVRFIDIPKDKIGEDMMTPLKEPQLVFEVEERGEGPPEDENLEDADSYLTKRKRIIGEVDGPLAEQQNKRPIQAEIEAQLNLNGRRLEPMSYREAS